MPEPTLAEPSDALCALVPAAVLLDLSYTELSARRAVDGGDVDDNPSVDPSYSLFAGVHSEEPRFLLRFKVTIDGTFGVLVVETQAEYEAQGWDRQQLTQALVIEYANHVGVMAMIPYARQALSSLSQQVFGAPLLMPVMSRGEIVFPGPTQQDERPAALA